MEEITAENVNKEAADIVKRINQKYGGGPESTAMTVTIAETLIASTVINIATWAESPKETIDVIVKGLEKAIEQGVRLGKLNRDLENVKEGKYGAN